jgi:DNA anti-recombination protein RmuC
MVELKGLRGKNMSVIKHMRARIEQEQAEFDASGAKIHAVRSVHLKLLRDVFALLGTKTLKAEMAELTKALRQPGIKLGVRKAYGSTFERMRAGLSQAASTSAEIQSMLTGTFRQLNAEYGFSLQAPREPELARYERDLDLVERSHMQYLGLSNALRLAQPEFADRLVRALATRLRVIYESALGDVELWNKSAAAQLDAQLRERRRNFGRRIEAIERIQAAASGLNERIAEIEAQEAALDQLDAKLSELTAYLTQTPAPEPAPAIPPGPVTVEQAEPQAEPVRKTA